MKTALEKRKNILAKINKMSDDKLDELLKVVNSFESGKNSIKDTMSLAGSWKEIDDEIFIDFTERLVDRRNTNSRRSSFMLSSVNQVI
jgi:hypothetical protein